MSHENQMKKMEAGALQQAGEAGPEKNLDKTVEASTAKQQSWARRWAERIKKGFNYVHERSVAFNERGFDGDDIVEWSKKLENGGFGDGTKMYKFFAERGWKSKDGFQAEMKKQGLQYKGEREQLGKETEIVGETRDEAKMEDLIHQALKMGQKINVMGEGFVITSMYERNKAKTNRDESYLQYQMASEAHGGHAREDSKKKNESMTDFLKKMQEQNKNNHGGHNERDNHGGGAHH